MKSGHHCCPCQAPPPPVLVTTSPSARIIRQSSQPEASACCCSGCCCPLHSGTAPSAASLRQLREPGDGIAGIAADSLRINGGIRQFRQVRLNSTRYRSNKGFAMHPHPPPALCTRSTRRVHTSRLLWIVRNHSPFFIVVRVYHAFMPRDQNLGATCNIQTPAFTREL